MGSLQDQLLKAGLATPEQLRKARAEQRREQRREPRGRRDAKDGSRTPGLRPPGRSRGTGAPAPGSAPSSEGDPGRGKDGATARGKDGGVRHRRGGAHRRPDPGRAEGARGRPAEPASSQDASVQALNLRIRELLDRHAVNDRNAEIPFSFARENVVRRVYVTDAQRRQLAAGGARPRRLPPSPPHRSGGGGERDPGSSPHRLRSSRRGRGGRGGRGGHRCARAGVLRRRRPLPRVPGSRRPPLVAWPPLPVPGSPEGPERGRRATPRGVGARKLRRRGVEPLASRGASAAGPCSAVVCLARILVPA